MQDIHLYYLCETYVLQMFYICIIGGINYMCNTPKKHHTCNTHQAHLLVYFKHQTLDFLSGCIFSCMWLVFTLLFGKSIWHLFYIYIMSKCVYCAVMYMCICLYKSMCKVEGVSYQLVTQNWINLKIFIVSL